MRKAHPETPTGNPKVGDNPRHKNLTIMANVNLENSVFSVLSAVDVTEHVERKGNLSYLSWAWAWKMVKSLYPNAFYTVYETPGGWFYHTDGRTAWVKVGVTIEGLEHVEFLPVLDSRNQSIPLESVTSFDVNRSIQRAITKACARHGLGLSLYSGEDLSDSVDQQCPAQQILQRRPVSRTETVPPPTAQDYQPSWRQYRSQYVAGRQ